MKFAQPQFLWLLCVIVPFLVVFFIWTWRIKQKLIRQFVQSRLLASLTVGVSHGRQKLRLVLLTATVFFALLALARPQWGFVWQEAKQQGIDIIVAVDTSRSMLAEDVPPNRLTRAKLASMDLMRQAKNDRLGLIAFAGTAFLQSPLTLDENAFRQGVDALDIGIIPQGGTSLSDVINTANDAFEKGSDNHKVLVIFTDGEDHDDDSATLAAAEEAAKNGLIIFTIGVGTPAGEMVRAKDENGNMNFIKDADGNAVKSHLNEDLLQKIATTTPGGFYLPLVGADPMETLYRRGLAPLPKSDSSTKLTRVYNERYHWPLGVAILCLLLETFLPERKRVKQLEPARATEDLSGGKTAAAIVTCLLLAPMLTFSSPSTAFKNFESGKYGDSLKEYEILAAKKTNDYRLQYNAGTAAYRAKDLASAQKHLNSVLSSPEITTDLPTQQHTYYNLGNTLFQLGGQQGTEPDKQQELWEQAIENYNHALKLDTQDKDAKNNLEFVKKRLEELKKQQQQQQKDDKNNKDNKDNKDDKKDQDQKDQKDQNKDQKDQNKDSKDQKDQKDKKDQQSKDQKNSQDKKNQQGKNDDKKSQQEKQKEEQQKQQDKEKEKQDKAKRDKEKKEKEKQAQEQQEQAAKNGQKPEEQQAQQQPGQPARMTMQQAKQFLDAQKDQEKALIFTPENKPEKPRTGKFKDW